MKNTFKKIFGYCEYCRKYFKYPKRRELNTAYVNEEDNWMCSCKGCYDEVWWTTIRNCGKIIIGIAWKVGRIKYPFYKYTRWD